MSRIDDLRAFYRLLDTLRHCGGEPKTLGGVDGRMPWPERGCYFFFEPGEERTHSGSGPRVVRVGTHAVSTGSRTTLWNRLSQHRGAVKSGGGNHRGSIFRKIVGQSLMARSPDLSVTTWGKGITAPREVRRGEHDLECEVSRHICGMPFLWIAIDDAPSADSLRGYIERNAIALLSNYRKSGKAILDPPSDGWLGLYCPAEKVRRTGIWNSNHVDSDYDAAFLLVFERLMALHGT